MDTVLIKGRFLTSEMTPMAGKVSFIPLNPIVDEDADVWHASLASEQDLDRGKFACVISPGTYRVISPVGTWMVHVPPAEQVYLSSLIPSRSQ